MPNQTQTRPFVFSVAALVLLAAMALGAAGCGHIKTPVLAFSDDGAYLPREAGHGLVRSPQSLIPDVPMPVGFKVVPSLSGWHYDGQVRVIHHVYQGHATLGDTVDFYQRSLASFGWALSENQSAKDATVLRYVKGLESLTVQVTRSWGVCTVNIDTQSR